MSGDCCFCIGQGEAVSVWINDKKDVSPFDKLIAKNSHLCDIT